MRLMTATFFSSMLACAALAQTEEARIKELPNFHQVNERLYRGAQPKEGGFQALAARGIRTVLNLRAADDRARAEETEARAAGLRYFNIPMEGLDRPTNEQVESALKIIDDAANQPVFVHCKHGSDRTGTLIAIYRMTHDGWSSEEALREAKRYGLSFFEFGMKDFIKDYGRDHAARPIGENRRHLRIERGQSVETSHAATAVTRLLLGANFRFAPSA